MQQKIIAIIFALTALSTMADEVILKNGSIIKGKVIKVYLEKLIVETDFSPNIELDFDKVVSFTTDEEHSIKLSDGQILNGKISYQEKQISVQGEITQTNVESKHLAMLWDKGERAPDYVAPFEEKWSTTGALDFNKSEGNTDESNLAVHLNVTKEGENDTLQFYGKYKRSETDGEKTDDERIVGTDYEYRYSEHNSWYVRSEFEEDEFEDLELRSTIAAGFGHYFYKEEKITLRNRLGLFYRNESYENSDDEETVGLDIGLHFKYLFVDFGNWYTDISFTPSIEDFADYRLDHESGLSLPVGSGDRWSIKLGVSHEYNSEPADDTEDLDTTYFSRLELKF